uniref:serine/threonine protein kinase n=1 Tax=Ruminococcus bromii TaxID=40518 RepID=UPI003FEEEB1E
MLEIGSVIDGKYKILNVVGKGGMSVVYLAMNERANKQWAIKEVRKDGMQSFEVVKQNLVAETDLLKKLNHPHLPSIIDVIDCDDTFLIVMDYIEGNPLSKALETSGAQNQDDVIEWAKQLCDVLGYLHSRKPPIIYRDMKPSNVMLKPDGNVMLIDFGTAREFKSTSVADTTCLGTQGYAAPEQFGGHGQTDARTDIYCLGATMYHLVTGHNPATPPYEMYPIRQWNPMLSSGLEEIILKCTQRNPEDRYQSCAELLYALDHYKDLDIENKKVQSFKWKTFLASFIMTIVMLVGTIGFSAGLTVQTSSTYESYIANGDSAVSQDAAEKYYLDAINVDPANPLAYQKLLERCTSDSKLSEDEYNTIKDEIYEHEDELKSKYPSEYADNVAYKLGQALYFSYVPSSQKSESENFSMAGITVSQRWLDIAQKMGSTEQIKHRAELLSSMSKAYQNMSGKSLEGDPVEEVKEYWNNLVEIASPNIAKEENNQIALLIYRNVTSQIYTKYYWFIKNSLATAKDISNELDNIEKYVNEIKVAVPDDEELQILVNECLDNIENTRSLDNSEVK